MSRYLFVSTMFAVLLCSAPPAGAIVRSWDDGAANSLWISSNNWSPDGVPESVDDVNIGALPTATDDTVQFMIFGGPLTDTINSLGLSNGADLDTRNGRLVVIEDTVVGGGLAGGTLSELIASPFEGGDAIDTNTLTIQNNGRLTMTGASISVDGTGAVDGILEVQPGGAIFGYGVIDLDDNNIPDGTESMVNDGTITVIDPDALVIGEPPATTLQINAPNDPFRFIDLSGDSGASEVNITRNTTLDLNTNTFDSPGVLRLFANSTLELSDNSVLNIFDDFVQVNSGATDGPITLPAAPAVITGGQVILGDSGEISLNEADEALIFESPFDSGIALGFGSETISNAGTIYFAGNAQIRSSTTFNTFGTGRLVNEPGSQLRLFDGVDADTPITNNGDLTIGTTITAGQVRIDGFTQTSTGSLHIKIGDILPGDFDMLTVDGNAILGGTLAMDLIDDFEPILGNSFTILQTVFGNISGEFDIENVPEFNGLTFDVVYNAQSVVLEVVAAVVPGDFDGDGDVDGADFVIWQTNFPTESGATLATGDADGDGDVDGADFVVWQTNFPFTPSSGAAPVPEPTSMMLALLAVGGTLCRGRKNLFLWPKFGC